MTTGLRLAATSLLCVFGPVSACTGPGDAPGSHLEDPATPDGGQPGSLGDAATPADGPAIAPSPATVYANTAHELFRIEGANVIRVDAFSWPTYPDYMLDLAIDRQGRMVGISYTKLYEVDPMTAHCTELAPIGRHLNALSFIPSPSGPPAEVLAGVAPDSSMWKISETTGQLELIGTYGAGWLSTGDIVSVEDIGVFAIVSQFPDEEDYLMRVDPASGSVSYVGSIERLYVRGLAFADGALIGFNHGREILRIDPEDGTTTLLASATQDWRGAAVTTIAAQGM